MLLLSTEEKEKWIEDYVERETTGVRKRVEDAVAAIRREQEDTEAAETVELTTREPKNTFPEMMDAVGDSLSHNSRSDDGEDGEDEDDEKSEQGQLSEDDEPDWVIGRITKPVQQRRERFQQKQMKHGTLTQPGWEDAADHFCERDRIHSICELRVPVVVQLQMHHDPAAPSTTTFGELRECLDIVPEESQMPHVTFRPGSTHMKLGSGKQ